MMRELQSGLASQFSELQTAVMALLSKMDTKLRHLTRSTVDINKNPKWWRVRQPFLFIFELITNV